MVRQKLGLSGLGGKYFDIAPVETLQKYFGEYSTTAKAYRTKEIPNAFFREVAKFLLEVGCVHVDSVYKTKDSYTLYEGLTKPIRWSCES